MEDATKLGIIFYITKFFTKKRKFCESWKSP